MEPWTDDMTARERIEAIALTIQQPRSVNWIKQQAEAGSWETTKSQLEHLVASGRLTTVEIDGEVRYLPDPMHDYLEHIQELVASNTKDELRDELEAITHEIEQWKQEYAVDSLEDLDATLGEEDLSPAEMSDRRRIISYWEENRQYRQLITHALRLYDDLTAQAQTVDYAEAQG